MLVMWPPNPAAAAAASPPLQRHAQPQTLRFKVCNGFANQRLAVVYGMLVAAKTGRSPVVPVLIGEGTQNTTQEVREGAQLPAACCLLQLAPLGQSTSHTGSMLTGAWLYKMQRMHAGAAVFVDRCMCARGANP